MADVFTKEKRSDVMSKIRSTNTKVEVMFCKHLSKQVYPMGLRYRRNYRTVKGSPDIVFVSQKVAVFIDGDFWHGRDYMAGKKKLPSKYWVTKIENNIARDKRVARHLRSKGWSVLRFWESDVMKNPDRIVRRVLTRLHIQR